MEFTIKLDRYEGPYTKLLDLINDRKLSITEISLVNVADDYIAYIKTLNQKNIVDISQFIVVASTLMLMKAKSLLPSVIYTDEEEKQVHDLEYKLALYALLNNAEKNLKSVYGKNNLFSREHFRINNPVFVPDERVTSDFLLSIALLTLATFEIPKKITTIAVEQAIRIEKVIESLLDRIKNTDLLSLQSLALDNTNKEEQKKILIVNFIAILELIRSGSILAEQENNGDILISKNA